MANDTISKTFLVAFLLCVVCAVVVATSAVKLRPIQQVNQALDKKKNILAAAGLYEEGVDVDQVYRDAIDSRVIDLESGHYSNEVVSEVFDQRKAAKDPSTSVQIVDDPAGIGQRSRLASIYLVKSGDKVNRLILPIHGKGLWSTLYGFLALDVDLNTIEALSFYQHGETPGLGGEVDNPRWKALWKGKKSYGEGGEARIEVLKGRVDPLSADAVHQVDGLSGATITSRGVSNMLRYWLGDDGFGTYLARLRQEGI
jgi:Na+-transporting NADH:ubiquinone oxidoreductase subunit C